MNNNKGFIFLETIIVTVVLTTTLIFLYSNFSKNVNDERRRLYYDDIAYVYKTIYIRNGIKSSINNDIFTKAINDDKNNNQNSLKNNFVFLFNSESKYCTTYESTDPNNMNCNAENYKSIYIDNTYAKNLVDLYNIKTLIYLKTSDLNNIKKCINSGADSLSDDISKKRCTNFLSFTNKYSESNLNEYILTINSVDADKDSIMLSLVYEKKNGDILVDKSYKSCLSKKIINSTDFSGYATTKDKMNAYYNQDDISYNMACENAYYISWVYYE